MPSTLGKCPREAYACGVLLAGLTSAGTLVLYAKGYREEAIGITIAATVLGAVLGAARALEHEVVT